MNKILKRCLVQSETLYQVLWNGHEIDVKMTYPIGGYAKCDSDFLIDLGLLIGHLDIRKGLITYDFKNLSILDADCHNGKLNSQSFRGNASFVHFTHFSPEVMGMFDYCIMDVCKTNGFSIFTNCQIGRIPYQWQHFGINTNFILIDCEVGKFKEMTGIINPLDL